MGHHSISAKAQERIDHSLIIPRRLVRRNQQVCCWYKGENENIRQSQKKEGKTGADTQACGRKDGGKNFKESSLAEGQRAH